MKVFYSPYRLEPKNEFSGLYRDIDGILLKFINEKTHAESFSLYHPIVALGDLSLEKFLSSEESRRLLLKKINNLSIDDSEALSGVVKSYYLSLSADDLIKKAKAVQDKGFKIVKLKASNLNSIDFDTLEELPFDYIFDFNGQEKVVNFENLNDSHKEFLNQRLEYIEDPYVTKRKMYFKLASDFIDYGEESDVRIVKPTGFNHATPESLGALGSRSELVVTSYLDHPLGQFLAAKWAIGNKISNHCGLWSHKLFKQNKYSELFSESGKIDLKQKSSFIKLLNHENWSVL